MICFLHSVLFLFLYQVAVVYAHGWREAAEELLSKGDAALHDNNKVDKAIEFYSKGIDELPYQWSRKNDWESVDGDRDEDDNLMREEIQVVISLYTNYGTALTYQQGSMENVLTSYRTACLCYRQWKRQIEEKSNIDSSGIDTFIAQSYFLLGMTYQDLASSSTENKDDDKKQQQIQQLQQAARAYAAATQLDHNHWSSYANLAVVLSDVGVDSHGNKAVSLELHDEAIMSYQKAIKILTSTEEGATDPPANIRGVVAELHYRIGLSLVPQLFNKDDEDYDEEKKCTLHIHTGENSKPTTRSCLELSAYQFNAALQFDDSHEGAHNALTIATADAIFGMSTDPAKVQNLFEDYADDFENSLVGELGYNAFTRMRAGFDRAMSLEGREKNMFQLVIDAGCGTGLAGTQFHNVSKTLVGVDLSNKIIQLAKQRSVYDDLKVGNIEEFLHQYKNSKQKVSLLIAADTFIYWNDLNNLFSAISAGLEENGYAIFSLENVPADNEKRLNNLKPDWRWQLTPSGRVAHREKYVKDIARARGLSLVSYERIDGFRQERGQDVRGHLFVFSKKQQASKEEL